jgi:hypothetical protein
VPNVYARTFMAAAELVGGDEELARRLGIAGADLAAWMSGCGAPPLATILKAADLITDAAAPVPGNEPCCMPCGNTPAPSPSCAGELP